MGNLFFFFLFGLAVVGMYLAVRRRMTQPGLIAAGGMIASVSTMTLFLLTFEDVVPLQAIIFGVLIGALFTGATLATAWYFLGQELKARRKDQ